MCVCVCYLPEECVLSDCLCWIGPPYCFAAGSVQLLCRPSAPVPTSKLFLGERREVKAAAVEPTTGFNRNIQSFIGNLLFVCEGTLVTGSTGKCVFCLLPVFVHLMRLGGFL